MLMQIYCIKNSTATTTNIKRFYVCKANFSVLLIALFLKSKITNKYVFKVNGMICLDILSLDLCAAPFQLEFHTISEFLKILIDFIMRPMANAHIFNVKFSSPKNESKWSLNA